MLHDEEAPRPNADMRPAQPLAQPLERLGIAELHAYIAALHAEIARAEAEITRKDAVRNAADSLFRTT